MTSFFSFEQLQALVLVVDRGSFSAAAEMLGISQPAVSQQVRELERRLGTRLLERVGRKVAPTPAGGALLGHARSILELAQQASDAVRAHDDGIQGSVRLGTGATACLHLLPPVLRHVRAHYPAVQVLVTTGNTEHCVRRVEQNTLDFALVTLPVSSRALSGVPVREDPYVLIGPPGAPRLPKAVAPRALSALPLLLLEPGANTRTLVDAWLLAGGVKLRPTMELGSIEAIKEMVAEGLGYSIIPRMAQPAGSAARFEVRALQPPLARELGLILRQDKPVTRAMGVVAEAIVQGRRP